MSAIPRQAPTELPADFGRYRLLKLLGKGGMGSVYLAHDTQLDRPVALKIPLFDGDDSSQVLARFFREARAAAALHHPNICPIHDVGDCDGLPYLTMAYIEGKPLLDFALARPLLPKQSGFLVRKLAMALHEAHKRNVIHRDLKPANIMIDKRGEPIIMDFGLARRVQKADPRLTEKGKLLGTPAYMPPEQITGDLEQMGPASDIYSLGVILYELLAGRLPFAADDMMAMLSKVLMDEPPPPSKFRPDLEPELERICLKAMAKKVKDRYANMGELAAALFDYLRPRAGDAAVPPAAAVTPKPPPKPIENKEPAGLRVSEMGGLRSVAQLQAQLPAARERDDTKVPRRKKRRKSARRPVPIWAWCSAAAALVLLLVGWLIYSAGNHGSVRIEVNPAEANAEIEINGKGGHRPGEAIDLPVGTHHLTVLARRYEIWRQEIDIHRGENPNVVVTLTARQKQKKTDKTGDAAPLVTYVLERAESRRVWAVLTADISQPNAAVRSWYNYAPRPPDLPGQEIIKSAFTGGAPEEDLSEGKRPLFFSKAGEAKKAHLVLTVDATLYSRRLSPAGPGQQVPEGQELKAEDGYRFTQVSASLDAGDSSLQQWLTESGLKRGEGENDLAFARRVFLFLRNRFSLDNSVNQDRRASRVCKAGKGDAGGLCCLYVTLLRGNGVPARVLFGRRAFTGAEHVTAEFFARGVGWVPVDVAQAIRDTGLVELAHFGDDPGDLLVLHIDPDIHINNPAVSDYTDFTIQNVWSWWQGAGSDQGRTSEQKWLLKPAGSKGPSTPAVKESQPVKEEPPPISGDNKPGVKNLDDLMLRFRAKLGATAASVALARRGVPWVARGYGWNDPGKTVPAQPDVLMGIACDQPLMLAAVQDLVASGKLNLNDRVYEALKLPAKFVPPRDKLITLRKLVDQVKKEEANPNTLVAEGLLRQVILKASKKAPADYYRQALLQPNDTPASSQMAMPGSAEARRFPSVWNAHLGWPLCASAPALCAFMGSYGRDGELRGKTPVIGNEFRFGRAPGGVCLMLWRSDGIDAVVLFNNGGNVVPANLARQLGKAIDRLKNAK
jgi:hypothetical protein